MKRLLYLTLFIAFGNIAFAKPVDEATAKKVAQNFLISRLSFTPAELTLAYTSYAPAKVLSISQQAICFYVFNAGNKGFVIVAADDRVTPILGFSDEAGFVSKNMSPEVGYMLNIYAQEIDYDARNNVSASDDINAQWANLIKNSSAYGQPKNGTLQSKLLNTMWDQQPYYNALCPQDNSAGYTQLTVTGCVATAMAQVIEYWNWPATGNGLNTYYDYPYGYLAQNFGKTTYNWDSMNTLAAKRLTAPNPYIATLMYQCGVAVDMTYNIASKGGSAAYVIPGQGYTNCAEYALTKYFGYANSISGLNRQNYTDAQWITLLENDIWAKRPVIYAGYEPSGDGHCFVFDGYRIYDGVDYFDINWGWSGLDNGYYTINALNPANVGTGGGSGDFNYRQQAIMGIQPAKSGTSAIQNIPSEGILKIYPNPANTYAIANLAGFDGSPQLITLINTQGQVVYSQTIGNDKTNIEINTANISDGVYFVRVVTDKGILNSKLVVAK